MITDSFSIEDCDGLYESFSFRRRITLANTFIIENQEQEGSYQVRLIWPSGSVYQGSFVEDGQHGFGIYTEKDNDLRKEGWWDMNTFETGEEFECQEIE